MLFNLNGDPQVALLLEDIDFSFENLFAKPMENCHFNEYFDNQVLNHFSMGFYLH